MANKYISIFILLLFIGAYPITYLLYNDIYEWTLLHCKLIENPIPDLWNKWYLNIIFIAFTISLWLNHKFIGSFWSSILLGLAIGNVIDSVLFNCFTFGLNDIATILITVLTSYYKYVYVRQRR